MTVNPVHCAINLEEQMPGKHLGLIVLDCDQTTERDFMLMRPSDVHFYTTRILYAEENTLENLKVAGDRLKDAASLILPNESLSSILYSCTSGTVAVGIDGIARQIGSARPDVPVITPMSAGFKAFKKFGVSRLSLLTPYRREVAQLVEDYIVLNGVHVSANRSMLLEFSSDLHRVSLETLIAAAGEAIDDDSDALFISCTGLRSVEVVQEIEERLGKPVFTSNQCMFWDALRQAGHVDPVSGFGRLLATSS